jgi:hypothetical protein
MQDAAVGDELDVLFSAMYSAYDGQHQFRLPAIAMGIQGATWSARPADAVELEPDFETGGVMITMRRAGDVRIIARAGALSGSAMLRITASTPEQWELGRRLYDDELPLPADVLDGAPGLHVPDVLSCSNCHGRSASALDVEHTPQQTGGFSDEELAALVTMGAKPASRPVRTMLPAQFVAAVHTWNASVAQKQALVTYLRSIAPATQGPLDFPPLP